MITVVTAIIVTVIMGILFGIVFVVLSPKEQCKVKLKVGNSRAYNVCILPENHDDCHMTIDSRRF